MTSIGVFAPRGNAQAGKLMSILPDQGIRALFFDLDLPQGEEVVLDETGGRWNGTPLAELDTAYVHGFSHESPVVPAPGQLQDGPRDWSVWQADYPAIQQKFSFLASLFTRLERHGVRLVNPMNAARAMFAKPHLLHTLARQGFNTPEILVTNDLEQATAWSSRHETVVWRPQNGRAPWQLCLKRQREAVVRADAPPPLLAEAKRGPIVRSWVFEGEPLLTLSSAPPSDAVPERLERLTVFDHDPFREELARLATAMAIPWFQVLFTPWEGKAWIYDIDADPILGWLPESFLAPLMAALAARLARKDGQRGQPEGSAQRPALFLRRMLRVLFDFERCKYGKGR